MTIRKKHISRYYTIVEVMVAMGIFLVMMTIMMQFFTSAQKVWNSASKRNFMYADARVAMNVMTREIQSMLYENEKTDGTGIYPFWLEWTEVDASLDTGAGETITTDVKDYFLADNDFSEQGGSNVGKPYLTALNFMSTTDLKTVDEGSDVCEIRYKFIPVYFTTSSPKSVNDVKGGKLVRSCVEEYSDTSTLTLAVDYNFADCYYRGINPGTGTVSETGYPWDERVFNIWKDSSVTPDPTPFQTVITGVYSLRFTCYFWNTSSTQLEPLAPMNSSGNGINGSAITSPLVYNLATGTPAPVAIRIDMKLMDPKDLKKLAIAIDESNTRQIKNLKQKMRTFSKVIYLGKKE